MGMVEEIGDKGMRRNEITEFYGDILAPTREEAPGMWIEYSGMSGYLTRANAKAVADLIRNIIGKRTFTFVVAGEWNGFKPEVRPNQRLTRANSDPSGVAFNDENSMTSITVCDSYGVWSLHVSERDEPKGRNEPLPRFATWVEFDYKNGWQMTFKLRAPGGNQIWWTVVVDEDTPTFEVDEKDEDGWQQVDITLPKIGTIFTMFNSRDLVILPGKFDADAKLLDTVYNEVYRG